MPDKLMIVAHPDDETIFGGAALLKEGNWKVICVTNRNNRRRAKEFSRAMNALGADYEMWDYRDRRHGHFGPRHALYGRIRGILRKQPYRKIVTHGLSGEYGHRQHKILSRILHKLVRRNLYTFGLSSNRLPRPLLVKKIRVLKKYKSQMYIIRKLKRYVHHEGLIRVKPLHRLLPNRTKLLYNSERYSGRSVGYGKSRRDRRKRHVGALGGPSFRRNGIRSFKRGYAATGGRLVSYAHRGFGRSRPNLWSARRR
uniref:PIG-L family deacetylase n=1 Tax=Cohnella candidum TaxID=2674991 RepID=A0A3G3JVP5_9BACL|nr:PIG-L family deacetylase [Cohnella candidum]